MASDKQIAANRQNAQKCHGATTPQGRAISSQNALKTGIDAKSDVIRTESREDYEALTADYYARFHPTVPEERNLVDILITSEWQRRRYLRADSAVWEQRFDETETTLMGKVYKERSEVFARVSQRINSAQRNSDIALDRLIMLRSKRPFDREKALPAGPPLEPVTQPSTSTTHPSAATAEPSAHTTEPSASTTELSACTAQPSRPATSRDCKGAVPKLPDSLQTIQSDAATEELNPKLVSFLAEDPKSDVQNPASEDHTPETPPETPLIAPGKEHDPPIAA